MLIYHYSDEKLIQFLHKNLINKISSKNATNQ